MKPTRLLILFIAMFVSSSSFFAEAGNENGNVSNGTGIILGPDTGRNPNKRPKMPSRQIVECTYDSGVLTFVFAIAEGICDLTVTDIASGHADYHSFDSSDLTVHVITGTLSESFVEIITENGNTYSGVLTSE